MFNKELYNTIYHQTDISNFKFLITGGAGFIGSNLAEYLLRNNAGLVRVLDNLSNGYAENISPFEKLANFEFINGDIRDLETCRKAVDGIDYISHQAALGSVPRSISDPITSNDVNISGSLNMLVAAKESTSLKRMVYAASSSTYGDSMALPKIEGHEGRPLSPYAVTKAVNEMYAEVFSNIYGLHTIGLRYFNVFGPKQNPNNPYAAVISIFCRNFIEGLPSVIFGDGTTTRDFTFIENIVQANVKAMFSESISSHDVFNIACGAQISLNDIIDILGKLSGNPMSAQYRESRKGDIRHSKASIAKAQAILGYEPLVNFEDGLEIVYRWYKNSGLIKQHQNE